MWWDPEPGCRPQSRFRQNSLSPQWWWAADLRGPAKPRQTPPGHCRSRCPISMWTWTSTWIRMCLCPPSFSSSMTRAMPPACAVPSAPQTGRDNRGPALPRLPGSPRSCCGRPSGRWRCASQPRQRLRLPGRETPPQPRVPEPTAGAFAAGHPARVLARWADQAREGLPRWEDRPGGGSPAGCAGLSRWRDHPREADRDTPAGLTARTRHTAPWRAAGQFRALPSRGGRQLTHRQCPRLRRDGPCCRA